MYLMASSARAASLPDRTKHQIKPRTKLGRKRTLQLGENFESRLVIRRTFSNVGRQDRIGVMEDISRLQLGSNEVADEIDLVRRSSASDLISNAIQRLRDRHTEEREWRRRRADGTS